MFSSSKLTEDQKESLRRWAAEGSSIADLQKKLKDEYQLSITYMDARFLILDLQIELVDNRPAAPAEPDAVPAAADEVPASVPTGKVTVTLDTLALPGMMVSGKVTFSDGETAIWVVDQTGRPGLEPSRDGYRPVQEDLIEFQKQLAALVRRGY